MCSFRMDHNYWKKKTHAEGAAWTAQPLHNALSWQTIELILWGVISFNRAGIGFWTTKIKGKLWW